MIAAGGGVEATSKYLKSGASDCIYTPVCPELLKVRIACILENIQMKVSLHHSDASDDVIAHNRALSIGNY